MLIAKGKLPEVPGSYLLWLYLRQGSEIAVGRLGGHYFRRGWYGYAGSAFGPGGLRARLRHHLKPALRCHWHIDYLRQHAEPRGIWFETDAVREHHWSQLLLESGAVAPLHGFGASDCSCRTHLCYLPNRSAIARSFDRLNRPGGMRQLLLGQPVPGAE